MNLDERLSQKNANAPFHPTGQSQSGIGITKREYIATAILSGLAVMAIPGDHNTPDRQIKELVPQAIKLTDELLKQLEAK